MQDFIRAISLPTSTVDVPLAQCLSLPAVQELPPRIAHALAQDVPQPVVYPDGGQFQVFLGAPLLATARASGIKAIACTVLTPPLAPGIREFLLATGQMYIGAELPVVLLAQTVWAVYFWTNAQALYTAQENKTILTPLDMLNACGHSDGQPQFAVATVEDLCQHIEKYMATYFLPPEAYTAASNQVLVPWEKALAPFPHAPSRTKRKALMRLYNALPPALRPEFRQLQVTVRGLRWLADLPEEPLRRILTELQAVPPPQQRGWLARISQPGGWSSTPPARTTGRPPDALLAEPDAPAGARGRVVYEAVRNLHRASQLLQSLPARPPLSAAQVHALRWSCDQLWDLVEPLLSGSSDPGTADEFPRPPAEGQSI